MDKLRVAPVVVALAACMFGLFGCGSSQPTTSTTTTTGLPGCCSHDWACCAGTHAFCGDDAESCEGECGGFWIVPDRKECCSWDGHRCGTHNTSLVCRSDRTSCETEVCGGQWITTTLTTSTTCAPTTTTTTTPFPGLVVMEDGTPHTYYFYGAGQLLDGGSGVRVAYNEPRIYIMERPGVHASSEPQDFHRFQLAGRTLNFTAFLNGSACSLFASVNLVSMPAAAIGSDGDWFCDASENEKAYCPEVEIMKANVYTLQSAAHPCSKPWSEKSCDSLGQVMEFGRGVENYGFSDTSDHVIDTRHEFVVSISFDAVGRQMNTTLYQETYEGRTSTSLSLGGAKIGDLWDDLSEGMVLSMSLRASPDHVSFDAPPCTGEEPVPWWAHSIAFSNFSISSDANSMDMLSLHGLEVIA